MVVTFNWFQTLQLNCVLQLFKEKKLEYHLLEIGSVEQFEFILSKFKF